MLRWGVTEDLLCNHLLVERRQCDFISFGDGIELLDVVGVVRGKETFDERIQDSVPYAESLYTSIDTGLPGKCRFTFRAHLQTTLTCIVGVSATLTSTSDSSLLASVTTNQCSSS